MKKLSRWSAIAALACLFLSACGGDGGTTTPPDPTVTLALSSSTVIRGQTATLTWSSTNADSCNASNGWTGVQPTSGSQSLTTSGVGSVSYTLTCTSAGRTGSATTVLTVAAPPIASFSPGTRTVVVGPQTVGSSGATLAAPSGSALDGVVVTIPAGALSTNKTVSLASDNGPLTVVNGVAGKVMALDFGGSIGFGQAVHISVPYSAGKIAVPYYVDATGHLHAAQVSSIDRVNNRITFDTFHASVFTWIEAAIDTTDSYATDFAVGSDGFQVDNRGSVYNRGGECFGISSFSLWYYENKRAAGNFYPRFMASVGADSTGQLLVGQNIIATRAFISITQQWNTYYTSIVSSETRLSDSENYIIIHNALLNTGNPILIYLAQSSGPLAHSVLATGFNHGEVNIYDVNFHNTVHKITYNPVSGSFTPYVSAAVVGGPGSTFDRIVYSGDGSLALTEPYQSILDDAGNGFAGSSNATLNLDNYTNGQTVQQRVVTLSGVIHSSQVLVTRLKVLVGSTQFQTNVAADGSFSIVVTLVQGTNHLLFQTQGNDSSGQLIDLPNSLTSTDFTLIGGFPTSAIYVTLTWDTNDTDIDTYVIDPTGDYSAYYHRNTADGGFLDYDVTTGYGPEHWLLTTANKVRWGQPYQVRLHYYSDHGNGPSNYTVSIQVGEGSNAVTSFYRGTLSVSSPSNDAPNGVGADWVNIATVTPVQPAASGTAASNRATIAAAPRDQAVLITAPVPANSERRKP